MSNKVQHFVTMWKCGPGCSDAPVCAPESCVPEGLSGEPAPGKHHTVQCFFDSESHGLWSWTLECHACWKFIKKFENNIKRLMKGRVHTIYEILLNCSWFILTSCHRTVCFHLPCLSQTLWTTAELLQTHIRFNFTTHLISNKCL